MSSLYNFVKGWSVVVFDPVIQLLHDKFSSAMHVEPVSMHGKTVLITGGHSGIGYETSRMIAEMEANVIIAYHKGRDEVAKRVVQELQERTGNKQIEAWPVEMASLQSVRELAERFLATNKPLDVLINNIGGTSSSKIISEDGYEYTFQINYLSLFLLTELLRPALVKASAPRVVNVASVVHYIGHVNFKNFNSDWFYHPLIAYGNAKLMCMLYTMELSKRLQRENPNAVVHALHPGVVKTNIWKKDYPMIVRVLIFFYLGLAFRNLVQGAMTTVHVAVSEEAGSCTGKFWESCRLTKPSARACDEKLAAELWERTEHMLGLDR
ncbi:uncharacterized protein VTP21DRAFT_7615 [Calcarisporiella thermophila]|uniref:uncharacterized protein n=1 Tax=Calcarisporiella thermophila TaxID=911321 RepID=UPI0037423125